MNEREVAELRRRFKADKSNITHVCGCYVNENKEIISEFDQSLATLSEEESEKLLSILRRTLSGTLGRNLLDITFETKQVVEGAEHRLLMSLRSSALKDKEALQTFFQHAIQSLDLEENYLILLAYDSYDVPYRAKDGSRQEDASSDVFTYLLCSVCPVKQTKPALSYSAQENLFHDLRVDWVWPRRRPASSSPPLTSGAPTSTTPSSTRKMPPRPTRTLWTPSSAGRLPWPPPSRWRPFRQCWGSLWQRSAAARWCSGFTTTSTP